MHLCAQPSTLVQSRQVFHFSIATHTIDKKTFASPGEQLLILFCEWESSV